ncbi:MAG: hypothetical protein ACFFDT_12255, partial [Candidatus Hodarchaeota archaeon]
MKSYLSSLLEPNALPKTCRRNVLGYSNPAVISTSVVDGTPSASKACVLPGLPMGKSSITTFTQSIEHGPPRKRK